MEPEPPLTPTDAVSDPELEPRPGRFRNAQPIPPARQMTDVTIQRFDHVYEVDPTLMGEHFKQQHMPAWDTLRIVAARRDHIADIHSQFADSIVLAGEESEVGSEPPVPQAIHEHLPHHTRPETDP